MVTQSARFELALTLIMLSVTCLIEANTGVSELVCLRAPRACTPYVDKPSAVAPREQGRVARGECRQEVAAAAGGRAIEARAKFRSEPSSDLGSDLGGSRSTRLAGS